MSRFIYADNAATTAVAKPVLEAMLPYYSENFGNPSSLYFLGRTAKKAVEETRETVAKIINASTNEIFFTSGGSEADNWAIKGTAYEQSKKGKKHIITSAFEHPAVLNTLKALEKEGFEVTYLNVHQKGIIDIHEFTNAIRQDTGLVTIMYANNEIGTIQPISEIGKICRAKNILFHTDAVQAIGILPIDVQAEYIDLLSMSAHKFYGPKGVGALYIKKGVQIKNLIDGGSQERKKRAGTENVPGIVGLGVALKLASNSMSENSEKLVSMRDKLINNILKIKESHLNGDPVRRLPGNINVCFRGIEGESLLLLLDQHGICGSSGSACTSGSLNPSHVLLAIGLPHEVAHGSLRLSLNDKISNDDINYISKVLPDIVEKLRAMSPLWEKIAKERV